VQVANRQPSKGRITIDSTCLTMFGEGEWKVREHSAEKRRVWYVPVQVAAGGTDGIGIKG
jgi:hypothetical protein